MAVIDFLKKATRVYDPSQNKIIIAQLEMVGATKISVDYQASYRLVNGTSSVYNAVVKENIKPARVSVTLLQTSDSVNKLYQLENHVRNQGGTFEIQVVKSGKPILIGNAMFEQLPNESLEETASDITFTFICDFAVYDTALTNDSTTQG